MRSNHTTAAQTDRPHTTADAANATIRQLLELRAGQHVEVLFTDDSQPPDFHEEGTVYHVTETTVKHSKNGEESTFNIHLGSDSVRSLSDPVFKISVSRSVSHRLGHIKDDPKWNSAYIQHRGGRTLGGGYKWRGQLQYSLQGVTVVADTERCPECGQPV